MNARRIAHRMSTCPLMDLASVPSRRWLGPESNIGKMVAPKRPVLEFKQLDVYLGVRTTFDDEKPEPHHCFVRMGQIAVGDLALADLVEGTAAPGAMLLGTPAAMHADLHPDRFDKSLLHDTLREREQGFTIEAFHTPNPKLLQGVSSSQPSANLTESQKCEKIDQLKVIAERAFELLMERGSALVSAAVTCMINIRISKSDEVSIRSLQESCLLQDGVGRLLPCRSRDRDHRQE